MRAPTFQDRIQAATFGSVVWDQGDRASVKGLHVRVGHGVRVFYVYYRSRAGAQRRPKIGEFGPTTVAQARERARRILDEVAIGKDPSEEWATARAAAAVKARTVADLFEKVKAEHWSEARYQDSGWAREAERIWVKDIEPRFGATAVTDLTVDAVEAWHATFKVDRPYSGNRALRVLSKMFAYAEKKRWVALGANPTRLVEAHPERKRKRYASSDELARIGAILRRDAAEKPAAVAFVYLLLLTGSRPSAIERATWDQLKVRDEDGQRIGILDFAGKTSADSGEDEQVIIPAEALALIDQLPRVEGETILGIGRPVAYWRKVRVEAGCPDLWLRDSRRTFASVGRSRAKYSMDEIAPILNQRSTQTTAIYAKTFDEEKIAAVTKIAGKMGELLAAPVPEK